MKTIVHVNQPLLGQLMKSGERAPVLTIKTYKTNTKADCAELCDSSGKFVLGRVHADLDKPRFGSVIWMEFLHGVEAECFVFGYVRKIKLKGHVYAVVEKKAIRENRENRDQPIIHLYSDLGDHYTAWSFSYLDEHYTPRGEFVYRPEKPLSCGARAWLETEFRVDALVKNFPPVEGENKECVLL